MQADQRIGIDLPLKLLIWEDVEGKVWLTYNDPVWIAERHDLASDKRSTVASLTHLLGAVAKEAAQL